MSTMHRFSSRGRRFKSRRLCRNLGAACLTALIGLLAAFPAQAQVSGISYTISPSGEYVFFEDDAALGNGLLYGGQAGFGFGELIELRGLFLFGRSFETDFSGLADADATEPGPRAFSVLEGLEDRPVDIRRYGLQLQLNVPIDNFVPFVRLGTGVLEIDPEAVEGRGDPTSSEHVYGETALGLTFSVADRYTLSVAAQGLAYRYNPASVFLSQEDLTTAGDGIGQELDASAFDQRTVYNPALTTSLRLYLGGRRPGELTDVDQALLEQFGGGGFRVAIEPFYGQIDFNGALNFPSTQALTGVNAGFDFGPLVGVRGFYWRGTVDEDLFDSDFPDEFADIHFYGGELNLRLGTDLGGRSIIPSLLVGGGYANTDDGYTVNEQPVESRYFAMGGAGVEIPISSVLHLQGHIRGLLMSTEDFEDVAGPSSVYVSPMYTVGLNFNLGGGPDRTVGSVVSQEIEEVRTEEEQRAERLRQELAQIRTEIDSLRQAQADSVRMASAQQGAQQGGQPQQTAQGQDTTAQQAQQRGQRMASNLSGQTMLIPVPEEGEIYLRFGRGTEMTAMQRPQPQGRTPMPQFTQMPQAAADTTGQLTQAEIRQVVQQALDERLAQLDTQGVSDTLTAGDVERIVQRAVSQRLAQQRPSRDTLSAREARAIDAQMDQQFARLEQRLSGLEDELESDIEDVREEVDESQDRQRPRSPIAAGGVQEEGGQQEDEAETEQQDQQQEMQLGLENPFDRQLEGVLPLTGYRFGNGPEQLLVGARGDFRSRTSRIWLVPEFALGFGEGDVSLNLSGNALVPFSIGDVSNLQPYAGGGLGFVTESGFDGFDFVINLLVGSEYELRNDLAIFLEYNTQDLFDIDRFITGVRLQY